MSSEAIETLVQEDWASTRSSTTPRSAQRASSGEISAYHHLEKRFRFPDFKEALAFVNRVGELAEAVDHHPELVLSWGEVRLSIWTHAIEGISETDIVFAAKCERIFRESKPVIDR